MHVHLLLLAFLTITQASNDPSNVSFAPSLTDILPEDADFDFCQVHFDNSVGGSFDFDFLMKISSLSNEYEAEENKTSVIMSVSDVQTINFEGKPSPPVKEFKQLNESELTSQASESLQISSKNTLEASDSIGMKFNAGSGSSSSDSEDNDSSSDFGAQKRVKKRKLERISKKSRSRLKARETVNEDENDLENDPSPINSVSPSASASNRSRYCNRAPFLYRTKCRCAKNDYNYISPAIKHMKTVHSCKSESYFDVIELVDDFNLISNYPLTCEFCPFRTNTDSYLINHNFYVHNIPRNKIY